MMDKISFIVNPVARNGYSKKIWKEIENVLRTEGVSYSASFTEYHGHAKEIVKKMAKDLKGKIAIIVVVGGDGTLHEAINGAVGHSNIRIADIPAGSGNDFSRGFLLPRNPLVALKEILENMDSDPYLVDVGKVAIGKDHTHCFINNLGAGFDALVAREANRSILKKFLNRFSLGTLVYAYILIKELFTYRSKDIILTVDGEQHEFEKTWFITVSNQPYIGGGMKLAPDAIVDDGLLDVTVVHHLSKIKLLLVFITVFWGGHKNFKELRKFRGRNISIISSEKMIVHADGEHIGETPVEVKILPGVLPIVRGNGSF